MLQILLISTDRLKAEFPWWLLELSFPKAETTWTISFQFFPATVSFHITQTPSHKISNKPNPSPTVTDTHPKKSSQPGHPKLGDSCNTTWWCRTLWRRWDYSSLKTEQDETGECFLSFIFRRWGSLKAYIYTCKVPVWKEVLVSIGETNSVAQKSLMDAEKGL